MNNRKRYCTTVAYPNSPRRRRSAFGGALFGLMNRCRDGYINQILELGSRGQGHVFLYDRIQHWTHKWCVCLLQETLGKELLSRGCRHHIFELVLQAAFSVCLRWSSGPEILFVIFTERWGCIDQNRSVLHVTVMPRHVLFPNYGKTCYCSLENSCELNNLDTIKENF